MRGWSFYIATADSTYAGHDGYDDVLEAQYAYDSSVPNHNRVSPGDLAVLRDAEGSLGVAFIEAIDSRQGTKRRRRCPTCRSSQVELRVRLTPKYRCTKGHTFDEPVLSDDDVTLYRAEYRATYRVFRELSAGDVERLTLSAAKQNAIRELDLDGTLAALRRHGVLPSFAVVE